MEDKILLRKTRKLRMWNDIYEELFSLLTENERKSIYWRENSLIYKEVEGVKFETIKTKLCDSIKIVLHKHIKESSEIAKKNYIDAGGIIN